MKTNEVLLGMNVLKHFELVQRGNQLIIRQYH
jgi:predicted aspartyl protease